MKFLRYLQKKRRAMLAMAALTFFAAPLAAQASTITDKDGKALTPTNKVYNIKVQKELSGGKVGVNRFKDFTLDSGEIANMQFGKLQTLANLVEKKININGTVNALRNGKIGGNLYFLSPNGIAVGSTGVINAGAFTGMAVARSYFDELDGIDNARTFMTKLAPKNIVYNNSADRGIDIQGVINAPGGISLYASKIDIGSSAVLRTNVDKIGKLEKVDFKSVVNITSVDGSVLVDSGITGGLDASYKDGNIILKARAEHIADDNFLSGKGSTKWEKVTEREATINVDGTIKSAGKVSINAEAETEFKEGSYLNIVQQTGVADAFLGSLGIDCAVDFAKKDNTATVNIGKTADIYSKGDMDISSTAKLTVKISATTPGGKVGTTKATDLIPATSVAVISATNKATVNIDGKLESKEGTMAINAKADTSLSGTAKTATSVGKAKSEEGLKDDVAYIAIGIIDGETTAEVNINSGDEIKVGGKDYKKKVDDKEVDA
ncbi:MAG: leukotoxin LktA family filamentous adhesin, partial [Selenomonadaceae bacterium]|nr:leukotoxin LktA family filamentous adhesin [Selenomonadaceae bacterium]